MNLLEVTIAGAALLAPIILGLLMLVVGLKGIGRMLGFESPGRGPQFFCGNGTCKHELDEHKGDDRCKRCRACTGYVSQLHLDWIAYITRPTGFES